jgi:cell division protease FtsH
MAKRVDQEVVRIVDEMLAQTREILEQRREALEAVTQRLLEVESIDHDELKRLLDENCNGPWLVPGTQTVKPRAKLVPAKAPQAAHPPVDVAPTADNQI